MNLTIFKKRIFFQRDKILPAGMPVLIVPGYGESNAAVARDPAWDIEEWGDP